MADVSSKHIYTNHPGKKRAFVYVSGHNTNSKLQTSIFLVYISYRQIEQCAEIAFSARQNAENEYKQTHKKQVQY
jgi:hypothetical protein